MLFIVVSSCNNKDSSSPTTLTLYDSLGGTAKVQDPTAAAGTMIESGRLGIRSVVDSTIFVIAADPAINSYFNALLGEIAMGDLSGFQEIKCKPYGFFLRCYRCKRFYLYRFKHA